MVVFCDRPTLTRFIFIIKGDYEMSRVICPLGLIDNCESSFVHGRGCRNYHYCENITSITIGLPYIYNEKRKGLYVVTTYPEVFKWQRFRYSLDSCYVLSRHELTESTHEELKELGFAIAVSIPNFDEDIWSKSEFNPANESDDDDLSPF